MFDKTGRNELIADRVYGFQELAKLRLETGP